MAAALHFGDLVRDGETLLHRGARLAGGLYRLGLREGDVVAVLLRNDPVYADVMHACRAAGIYYCTLNWHFTAAELEFILADCGARVVLAHADLLQAATAALPAGAHVFAVGAVDAVAAAERIVARGTACTFADYESWLASQQPYAGPVVAPRGHMAYTSGTTGRPKGVRRAAVPLDELPAHLSALRALVRAVYGVEDGCRALVSAPLYHSAPASIASNTLLYGERLVLMERFDAEQTLALIERHRIDMAYLTPTMYVRMVRLPNAVWERYDVSPLRFVASTGAPCPPDVKRAIVERLGPVIHETYASTEAGLITLASSADALARPGTAGRPVGSAQLRILDDGGRECAPGEIGTIYARQPAYADFTYHNLPDARGAIERDGLITLGDVGYVDADGYLFVCDRSADMVLSGGVNIYPAEIEHALLRLPGVQDCAVVGLPDAEFGERLHGVVQPEPGAVLDAAAMQSALREVLAGYKVPRTFSTTDALPRDDNGKVARARVRAAMLNAVVPARSLDTY
ncbi:MAG: long-chain fatty acid--CoA ligase [Candidatus Eremiobacteraeota bacterium]|nr:long-chain fatty acid--CoA ligase [Candidatus Eremiobacteraeota bacterium]